MKYFELANFSSCLFMTGVIWLIQLVHYPSFHYIHLKKFKSFCNFHQKSITYIVFPAMLIELISSIALLLHNSSSLLLWVNLISVSATWFFTIFFSMPLHSKLLEHKSKEVINKLIYTNWPRTITWSFRSLLLSYFF